MLYSREFFGDKKEEFIFEAEPYNEDINIREVAAIQTFYEKNGYVPEKYITELLNYITYNARKNIVSGVETPIYSSLTGRCARAQSINDKLLEKLNLQKIAFNVGDVIEKEKIHALECVQIPTKRNDKIIKKTFILDPTFRQFCLKEENRFERYNEEPKFAVRMSTPHPGYFLNLTENGRTFANNLIHFGYFEATEENLKTYFDSFVLYTTPKQAYKNQSLIGKISTTTISGNDYWNQIIKNIEKPLPISSNIQIETPKEIVNKEDRKLLNKIRNKIINKKELDSLFIDEDSTLVNLSNDKKK